MAGPYTGAIPTVTSGQTSGVSAVINDLVNAANAFGPWTAYTPTLSGFTQGAGGVLSGRYTVNQKLCMFWALFQFGSGSAAASAAPVLGLPTGVPCLNADRGIFNGRFFIGSSSYRAEVFGASTSTVSLWIPGASGLYTAPTTTTPATWGSTSYVLVEGQYETA